MAAMRERGLDPDMPQDAVAAGRGARRGADDDARSRRAICAPCCGARSTTTTRAISISCRCAEALKGGDVKLLVAIADVDAAVAKGSPADRHAALNTTSVYTPGVIFPMLPERLSTDLTSLNDQQDRLAVVIEFVVSPDGDAAVVRRLRRDGAQQSEARLQRGRRLADGGRTAAAGRRGGAGHGRSAARCRTAWRRRSTACACEHGALGFETIEVETVFDGDTLHEVRPQAPNRAKALIANLMIAANGVTARFLDARGFPSLRRVVKSPERWDRIRALAEQLGDDLPPAADSIALAAFLERRKAADPATFPGSVHAA